MNIRKLSKSTASGALKSLVFVTWKWQEFCHLLSSIPCSEWPNGCGPIFNLLFIITDYDDTMIWIHFFITLLWESAFRMWVPLRRCQWCGALVLAWTICWTNSLLSSDLRCHDAHFTSLWYNTVKYISLISKPFKYCWCPHRESFWPENTSNLWIRFSWISF